MTTRLYYADSELRAFDAVVRSCEVADGRTLVVLDQTAFYPTSGGQPFDTGRCGDVRVTEVFDRDDGEVVHVVSGPLETGVVVRGEIDWPRRFDHMQQHTGQHMLSAAFDRLSHVRTTSFHLGAETATIDLAREVSSAEIDAAEAEANRVVWEDRPVGVRFASADEAARLPLRKDSTRAGTLRLVEVFEFDLSACGGTHVARTGAVGLIAVAAAERFKGGSRVTFVCGGRALRSHRALRDVVTAGTRVLSVTPQELVPAIERTQLEGRETARILKRCREELAQYKGAALRATAETMGPLRGVLRAESDLDAPALKALASAVVAAPGFMTVLVGDGMPAPVVIARSADVDVDASALMREAAAALGGRGGGTAALAQGGLAASSERVIAFVRNRLSGTA